MGVTTNRLTGQSASGGSGYVYPTGLVGTGTYSVLWCAATYADSDKWISTTGCHEFEVMPWDEPWWDADGGPAADEGLVIAWSTTYDDDLSAVMAAVDTGVASVVKTAKEATLTLHANCLAWNGRSPPPRIYSATAIKTIRMYSVTTAIACGLRTTTIT